MTYLIFSWELQVIFNLIDSPIKSKYDDRFFHRFTHFLHTLFQNQRNHEHWAIYVWKFANYFTLFFLTLISKSFVKKIGKLLNRMDPRLCIINLWNNLSSYFGLDYERILWTLNYIFDWFQCSSLKTLIFKRLYWASVF